jgi:hypothetical protein
MAVLSESIREAVRTRARKRCEYCRLPEEFSFYNHQVDHIIARKHRGSSDLENLAFACFDCNNAKGTDIASYDEVTDSIIPLFNPRQQMWDDHFRLVNGIIEGITPTGRVTAALLRMNAGERVEARQYLADSEQE